MGFVTSNDWITVATRSRLGLALNILSSCSAISVENNF